ncbi:hypothetical protein DPEC_G00275620 [Dallia pectoralis]|uniref:Uncharacterized protein n=1 Tax=Dallia pectoralis TaxID=75939 RepID=A0ACC2FLF4_DALPE|nr:hypothetical protein DPEC_G00275620 [Dallia pectoralis]
MSDSTIAINFSALERELLSAVEADKKYQRENDAKFRALHQKVGTYEEFRDIVLASHLKPLDAKDKAGSSRKQPWNVLFSTHKGQNQTSCDDLKPQVSEFQPRTALEFSRDWRRLGCGTPGEKYGLLLSLGGEGLLAIFKAEVGFGLLGEFIEVLSTGLQPGDESSVTDILDSLSKTPRFSLNMSLLSPRERDTCQELFYNIQKTAVEKRGFRVTSGDGVDLNGSDLNEMEETHTSGADARSPEPGQASESAGGGSETETVNRLILLYAVV